MSKTVFRAVDGASGHMWVDPQDNLPKPPSVRQLPQTTRATDQMRRAQELDELYAAHRGEKFAQQLHKRLTASDQRRITANDAACVRVCDSSPYPDDLTLLEDESSACCGYDVGRRGLNIPAAHESFTQTDVIENCRAFSASQPETRSEDLNNRLSAARK